MARREEVYGNTDVVVAHVTSILSVFGFEAVRYDASNKVTSEEVYRRTKLRPHVCLLRSRALRRICVSLKSTCKGDHRRAAYHSNRRAKETTGVGVFTL